MDIEFKHLPLSTAQYCSNNRKNNKNNILISIRKTISFHEGNYKLPFISAKTKRLKSPHGFTVLWFIEMQHYEGLQENMMKFYDNDNKKSIWSTEFLSSQSILFRLVSSENVIVDFIRSTETLPWRRPWCDFINDHDTIAGLIKRLAHMSW